MSCEPSPSACKVICGLLLCVTEQASLSGSDASWRVLPHYGALISIMPQLDKCLLFCLACSVFTFYDVPLLRMIFTATTLRGLALDWSTCRAGVAA